MKTANVKEQVLKALNEIQTEEEFLEVLELIQAFGTEQLGGEKKMKFIMAMVQVIKAAK